MFNLIYHDLKSLKKENFGFGRATSLSSTRRLGFGFNFLQRNPRVFRFVGFKKIETAFLIRVGRLLRNDLLELSSSINSNLQKKILRNIDFSKFNRSWRGVRHINNLPVRGQRTKTNARTRKSRRTRK